MVETRVKDTGKRRSKKSLKSKKPVKEEKLPVTEAASGAHEIPAGYNIDTIVLMPVNMDTCFVYWEVTERLLNASRKKLETGSAKLMVKVYEADGRNQICSFEVMERIGKSYINYQPSFNPLIAEIGVMNGKGFVGLLKSGTGSSLSAGPAAAQQEVWMTTAEGRSEIVTALSVGSDVTGSEIIEYYRKVSAHDAPLFSMR